MDNSQITQITQKTDRNENHLPQESFIDQMKDVSEIQHINREKEDQSNYSDVFGESVANMDQIPRFGAKNQENRINSAKYRDQTLLDGQKDELKQGNKPLNEEQSQAQQISSRIKDENKSKFNNQVDRQCRRSQIQVDNEKENNIEQKTDVVDNQQQPSQQEQKQDYELTFKPSNYKSAKELEQEKQVQLKERQYLSKLYDFAEKLQNQEDQVRTIQDQLLQDQLDIQQSLQLKNEVLQNTSNVLEKRKIAPDFESIVENQFYSFLKQTLVQTLTSQTEVSKKNNQMQRRLQQQEEQIKNLNKTIGNFNISQKISEANIRSLEQEVCTYKNQNSVQEGYSTGEFKQIASSTSPNFEMNQITEVKSEYSKDDTKIDQPLKLNFFQSSTQSKKPRKLFKNTWMSEKESFADYQLFGIPMEKQKKMKNTLTSQQTKQSQQSEGFDPRKKVEQNVNILNHSRTQMNSKQLPSIFPGKSIEKSITQLAKQNKEQFLLQQKLSGQQANTKIFSHGLNSSNPYKTSSIIGKSVEQYQKNDEVNFMQNKNNQQKAKPQISQPVMMKNNIKQQQIGKYTGRNQIQSEDFTQKASKLEYRNNHQVSSSDQDISNKQRIQSNSNKPQNLKNFQMGLDKQVQFKETKTFMEQNQQKMRYSVKQPSPSILKHDKQRYSQANVASKYD